MQHKTNPLSTQKTALESVLSYVNVWAFGLLSAPTILNYHFPIHTFSLIRGAADN